MEQINIISQSSAIILILAISIVFVIIGLLLSILLGLLLKIKRKMKIQRAFNEVEPPRLY